MAARRARAIATVGVLVGAVALTGCGTGAAPQQPIPIASAWHPGLFVDGYGAAGLGPTPTASVGAASSGAASTGTASPGSAVSVGPSASDTSLSDPTQATLEKLLLQQADVSSGLKVALDDNGASLSVATLAYCAGTYSSESAREARRRTVVDTSAGLFTGIASEAVLYNHVADATTALTELRAVAAACPSPRTATTGSTRITFTVVPSSDVDTSGFVPEADRVLVSTTVDDGTGSPYRVTRLWQRRGRVLVGLYYSGAAIAAGSSATFTAQDLAQVKALGDRLAERLDALDPAVVGTT